MKKYLLVLLMLPAVLWAQQQKDIDSIKFEMIKATVHFYATDTTLYKKGIPLSKCLFNQGYDCLKKFSDTVGLIRVSEKVNDWEDIACGTPEELQKLKEKIIMDLTGSKDKDYRKKLPEYSGYIKSMDYLIKGLATDIPTPPTSANKGVASNITSKGEEGSKTDLITWLALLAGLAGLGLSALLFTRIPKKDTKLNVTTAIDNSDKLEGKIATLGTYVQQKADNTTLIALQNRIEVLEKQQLQLSEKPKEQVVTAIPVKKAQAIATETTMYAKLPDLPNGFSNDIFKNEQNGEQVFEIVIKDNTATYAISNNTAAQDYALNDVNYILGRACTLFNQPFTNCRINTKEKGALSKTTEGWMIDKKAVVEFL